MRIPPATVLRSIKYFFTCILLALSLCGLQGFHIKQLINSSIDIKVKCNNNKIIFQPKYRVLLNTTNRSYVRLHKQ